MTPRRFVEGLRAPPAMAWEAEGTSLDACRLAEIDAWLWMEARWPMWGDGATVFVMRARDAVEAGGFEEWLDRLPKQETRP